jgi:hypothetical protein
VLTKLTTGEATQTGQVDERKAWGLMDCIKYAPEVANDCYTHGGEALAMELYEEQRVNSGGWF